MITPKKNNRDKELGKEVCPTTLCVRRAAAPLQRPCAAALKAAVALPACFARMRTGLAHTGRAATKRGSLQFAAEVEPVLPVPYGCVEDERTVISACNSPQTPIVASGSGIAHAFAARAFCPADCALPCESNK